MKEVLGILAVLLLFIGYIPYVRDTVKGKTKPHIYTWFVLGIVTGAASALQIINGAGIGALVTVSTALICFSLFLLSFSKGDRDITRFDTLCLILALGAIGIWVVADQPVMSVIILSAASLLGFVPTIRKSWHKPDQETLSTYAITSVRYGLGICALRSYALTTVLYPSVWLGINVMFCVYLLIRRNQTQLDGYISRA